MRQTTVLFTTLLTAILAVSGTAHASEQTDKEAIIKAYRALDDAFHRKDSNQYFSVYDLNSTQFQFSGQTAIVIGLRKIVFSKQKSSQGTEPRTRICKYQDTWKRTNNGWQLVNGRNLQCNDNGNVIPTNPPTGNLSNNRDYLGLYNLADSAIQSCYREGNPEPSACVRLKEIENTLSMWCSQGDKHACITSSHVSLDEHSKRSVNLIRIPSSADLITP
ncbi:hypothetical protein BV378_30260 [Nostoc sp. RF31YmG]|nr:hypothetical protein BV378_30260 [Nostoc sp. RF31YmG]